MQWSPDGRSVVAGAYVGEHLDPVILRVRTDGSGSSALGPLHAIAPAVSRSDRLAYVAEDATSPGRENSLYVDGAFVMQCVSWCASGELTWSPDERSIVANAYFALYRLDLARGLWVMNADGSDAHRVATGGGQPVWSPDGRWLAFRSSEGISVMRPDGTELHLLVADSDAAGGSIWSFDWGR